MVSPMSSGCVGTSLRDSGSQPLSDTCGSPGNGSPCRRPPRTVPRMSTPVRASRPLLASLVLGAAIVAAVALVGWMLLLFVKGAVVLISYALGIALVVVPLLLAHRLLTGTTGAERRQRIGTIAQVVGAGVALCVVAYFVGEHGWLLTAAPAAVVAALRLGRAVAARRHPAVR